jgi:hypothetical protein
MAREKKSFAEEAMAAAAAAVVFGMTNAAAEWTALDDGTNNEG